MHKVDVGKTTWASLVTAGVVAAFLLGGAAPAARAQGAGARISLQWAFVRLAGDGQEQVIDFSARPVVRAGDKLRVCLEPLSRFHLYLYLFDSSRDLALLYPPAPRASPAPAGEQLYLPGKEQWFTIDETAGEEQFFLLASGTRLSRLEDLTAAWLKSPSDAEAKARVLAEIKEQRRKHSSLTGAVEKGVPMAGTFQGRGPTVASEATLVTALEFYARTLRLVHE